MVSTLTKSYQSSIVFMDGLTFASCLIVTISIWVSAFVDAKDSKAFLYNNERNSDIRFYPRGMEDNRREGIYAHKYILADSSPVFYEMFYGESGQKPRNDRIEENVKKDIIAAFLLYIYKEECPSDIETFLNVLGLAKKYQVQSFEVTCKHSLEFNTPWPAFKVIEKLLEANAEDMAEQWWPRIESRIDEIIASEYFLTINQRTLIAFLERDTLCYPEIDLFHAVIRWSKFQCKLRRICISEENQRNVLGDAIYRIRFLTMSEEDFENHVVTSGILTNNVVNAIIETKRSGTGNYKYNWALPERNKRAWYCKYFSVEQIKNGFLANFFVIILLVAAPVFFHALPYFVKIYEEIQEVRLQQHTQQQQPST